MPETNSFDEYQKKAINVESNAVVSAGAGSGKTTVLSERFSYLITEKHYNVDQILTLTFTKKATVEMSDRIYKVLKKKAPEQAAAFFKANIKTLDSYCNSIAKIGAHFYGITPDFTQDDESISLQVYNMALPFILENRDNYAIKSLVKTESFDSIAQELFVTPILDNSTISTPIDFDYCIEKQKKEINEAWEKNSKHSAEVISQLIKSFENFDGNKETKSYINIYNCLKSVEGFIEPPQLSITNIESSLYEQIESYTLFVNSIAKIRMPSGNGFEEIKEYITEIKDLSPILISIVNYVSGFSITKNLIPLLKDFQDKVNNLKRSSATLTFKDVSTLAMCILRDYPEIRQIEKEKYKAIMIDEFQDNNSMQRDMLFMLAEKLDIHQKGIPSVENLCPNKLFFVGDEKQSIYKFRGADVSVFRALSNDFINGNLSMTTNYRSDKALIAGFNTIFGGCSYPLDNASNNKTPPSVFYTEKDLESNNNIPAFEAIYHEVTLPKQKTEEPSKPNDLQEEYKPHIHLALYDKCQEAEKGQLIEEEAEAEWVANKIKELTSNESPLGKKIEPSDIAILFKSYSLQPLYERTLLSHGIPYNTETVTGFFSDGPVNDIFAILRLCIYEKDTMSYAQVLRSPWVNLSIEETNSILILKDLPFSENALNVLEDESLNRYKKAKLFYEDLKESSKTQPLTTTISKIWYESGYRYETLWNKTVSMYTKMYDLIFELARQSEQKNMSLSAFVDSVRQYKDQKQKLEGMDIPLEQTAGVHLLSIHKSKGLEYPVVFICASHKNANRDRNDKVVYSSKEYGITINTPPCKSFSETKTNYFFKKVSDLTKAQNYAELRRLVYVALTRAKNELYITNGKYSHIDNAEEKYCPEGTGSLESIFQVLSPVVNYYFDEENGTTGPFSLEYISPAERKIINSNTGIQNNSKSKQDLIKKITELNIFNKEEIIKKDFIGKKYILPSQLHSTDDESYINGKYVDFSQEAPYQEINKIVEESIPKSYINNLNLTNDDSYEKQPLFGFNNFGSIAHKYLEAKINKEEPIVSNLDLSGLEGNKRKIETIKKICSEMAENFTQSEIGKKAIKSTWHKAEYSFKSQIESKIIKGTIDLVFKDDEENYTIIDYKTNQTINPEIYFNQLACYRQAISNMLEIKDSKKIKCFLYYLRYNKEVNITDECNKIDLNDAINKI